MIYKGKVVRGKAKVTFTVPSIEGVAGLHLAGDFNGWEVGSCPMGPAADGGWSATLALAPGAYEFRYCDDSGRWHNDHAADGYVPNGHGGDNCVVTVEAPVPSASARKAAAKASPAAEGAGKPVRRRKKS